MDGSRRTYLFTYLKRFLKKSILELAGRLCASRQLVSTLDLAKKLATKRNTCVPSPARISIKALEKDFDYLSLLHRRATR
jgi:hypothetical protein